MLEAFCRHKIPVFLSMHEFAVEKGTTWQHVRQILTAFPALRLILTDVGFHADRSLYPLFTDFPELRA